MKQKFTNMLSLLFGLAVGCIVTQVISYIDFSVNSAIKSLKFLLVLCILSIIISCFIAGIALSKISRSENDEKK